MKRYILGALTLFALFGVVFAPAGLLERVVETSQHAHLTGTRGTIWSGQARLWLGSEALGELRWQFQPAGLLALKLAYHWQLSEAGSALQGAAALSMQELQLQAGGTVLSQTINPYLRRYDINLAGTFTLADLRVTSRAGNISALQGDLKWDGGPVRYILSGRSSAAALPPLQARLALDDLRQPSALVSSVRDAMPLMVATLGDNGFAKIGLTRGFTRLLDTPWPGREPDHEVVIEVEEQIF